MKRNGARRIAYLLVAVLLASDFFTCYIPNGIVTKAQAIQLPSGDLKLPGASGDLNLPGASGDLKLPSASGDLKLPGASGDLNLPSASGDLKLPSASGDLNLPSASGDLNLPSASGNGTLQDIINNVVSGNGTTSGNGIPSGNDIIKDLINGAASGNGTSNNTVSETLGIPSGKVTNLHMTAATVDSITLSWAKCTDANWYVIRYWQTGARSTEHTIKTVGNVDTYTITGLSQSEYVFYVTAANRQEDGELKYNPVSAVSFRAAPIAKKPTGISLSNAGTAYASFAVAGLGDSDTSFYDTEAELYTASGRKLGTYTGNPDAITITDTRIKKNQFYKMRVRGTYTLADGTRQVGQWSSYKYFSVGLKSVTGSAGKTSISLSWSKVTGATSYAVYLKKSGADSYKKVKTVKAKKQSAKITKYGKKKLKKNTMYYVKVVAICKKGNSTYKCKSQVYKVKTKK